MIRGLTWFEFTLGLAITLMTPFVIGYEVYQVIEYLKGNTNLLLWPEWIITTVMIVNSYVFGREFNKSI